MFGRKQFLAFKSHAERPSIEGALEPYERAGSWYGRAPIRFGQVAGLEIVMRVGLLLPNSPSYMLWADERCFSRLDVNDEHMERGEMWAETHLHVREGLDSEETATRTLSPPVPPVPEQGHVSPHIYRQVFQWFVDYWKINTTAFVLESTHYEGSDT